MSEFSTLYIAGYEVDYWRNCAGGEVAILFTEGDLMEVPSWDSEGDEEDVPEGEGGGQHGEDEEEDEAFDHLYVSTAGNVIDRLEVLGFTLDQAKKDFEEGVTEVIEDSKRFGINNIFLEGGDDLFTLPPHATYEATVKFYEGFTFAVWSRLIKEVIGKKMRRIYSFDDERQALRKENPHLYHVLESHDGALVWGFPAHHPAYIYRAMLEVVPSDAPVTLDISSLVGYVEPYSYTCEPPKTVILTEGSSDKRILQESLSFLYPHLYDYYSFIDFDLTNMPGSTGHLLNIVKAFVATGVERRTVAIFDNDAAGHDALRQLANIPLPENIKVMALPHLDFATRYPTVGPQGRVEVDINGLACSLELYLGRDILQDAAGDSTPVQWGGWMPGARRYQGEIQNKAAIQERYFRLLSKVSENPELMETHDWSGMRLVLQGIFDLFKV